MITPRLQLWKEEAAIVSALTGAVPDGGTIVEIGTAEGGTARLAHEACAGRGVAIYTVDIAPSAVAIETLAGTGVEVVARPSTAFAGEWAATVGRSIDYLFIDGNHDLEHVVSDWNAWLPHLSPGARVAFHDFDPVHRGGLAHLAVRVCGDTILRRGLLAEPAHQYKLLHGRVNTPGRAAITADDCRDTLAGIAGRVVSLLTARAGDLDFAVDGRFEQVLRVALDRGGSPASPRTTWWRAHGETPRPEGPMVELQSSESCYLIEQALARNYHGLAALASVHTEFLVWGEALQMLAHGWPGPRFPERLPPTGTGLSELSSYVAREQVRLMLLARLLGLCVDWKP